MTITFLNTQKIKTMEKILITPPAGYKIVETIVSGIKEISFKAITPVEDLPKTWEEYGSLANHSSIDNENGSIFSLGSNDSLNSNDGEIANGLLPKESQVVSLIALCKLICLRDRYNGDWVADFGETSNKYIIYIWKNTITTATSSLETNILAFKTEELRDLFLENFSDLIIEAKEFI